MTAFITEVFSPQISAALQENLFAAGYRWKIHPHSSPKHTDAKYIGVEENLLCYAVEGLTTTKLPMAEFVARFCQTTKEFKVGDKTVVINTKLGRVEYEEFSVPFEYIRGLLESVIQLNLHYRVGSCRFDCLTFKVGCLDFTIEDLRALVQELSLVTLKS